jgi:hypothetical protein
MFNTFSECAGLRVNFDKTEATWLGSRRNCHEQLSIEYLAFLVLLLQFIDNNGSLELVLFTIP